LKSGNPHAGSHGDVAALSYDDFTERHYREVLNAAAGRFRFERFGTDSTDPHVLWRHDVDLSVHRAVQLARLESDLGLVATYFLLFHSEFYNLLERGIADRARSLVPLGHEIGLHFDTSFYGEIADADVLTEHLAAEAVLLSDLVEAPIRSFSFHNPGAVNDDLSLEDDEVAGLINAYGKKLRSRYHYVSDTNGYWRFERLHDVILEGGHERLHVLTHPGWWQAEPMAPRQRVARCVQGRAERTLDGYDELLARAGRQNVR
jgi:hypothetical protein